MYIKLNKVTWFSKLLALGLLFFVVLLSFLIGGEYQKRQGLINNSLLLTTQPPKPLSLKNNLTAEWKIYRNNELGFTFKYPALGLDSRVKSEITSDGVIHIWIEYMSSRSNIWLETATFFAIPNSKKLSLENWFSSQIDKNNSLINSGSFKIVSLTGGGRAYVLDTMTGLPAEYFNNDGAPVGYAYLIVPDSSYAIGFTLSHDHDLYLWYSNNDEIENKFLKPILKSIRFTNPTGGTPLERLEFEEYGEFGNLDQRIFIIDSAGSRKEIISSVATELGFDGLDFLELIEFSSIHQVAFFEKIRDGTEGVPLAYYLLDFKTRKFTQLTSVELRSKCDQLNLNCRNYSPAVDIY